MKSRIRKFYLHSKLNFGKYAGKTVAEVIAMDESHYLVWCDDNMPKICFDEEAKKLINKESAQYFKEKADEEDHEYAMDQAESGWDGHKLH